VWCVCVCGCVWVFVCVWLCWGVCIYVCVVCVWCVCLCGVRVLWCVCVCVHIRMHLLICLHVAVACVSIYKKLKRINEQQQQDARSLLQAQFLPTVCYFWHFWLAIAFYI